MYLVFLNSAVKILGSSDMGTLKRAAEKYGCLHYSSGVYRIDVDRFVACLDTEAVSEVPYNSLPQHSHDGK